jgi:hypothetical protein
MDSVGGFFFSKVGYMSPTEGEVSIDFRSGGNVVAGASNTGKSYLFQSIEFILGSSAIPKTIPEATRYDRVFADLVPYRGGTYRLIRALKGGDFELERSNGKTEKGVLAEKHNPKDEQNISTFLLKLSDLAGHKVLRNQAGALQNVTFRTLAPSFLVDEQRILSAESPALTGQFILRTAERNTFRLLITGSDDSAIVSKPIQSTRKTTSLDDSLIQKLIDGMEAEIASLAPNEAALLERTRQLDASIATLLSAMELDTAKVSNTRNSLNNSFGALVKAERRGRFIAELLTRLDLLEDQYESDLQRLSAIAEVHHYFGQLRAETCPVCGARPENHNPEVAWHLNPEADYEQIVAACNAEMTKINRLKKDLHDSIVDLAAEKSTVDQVAQELRLTYSSSIEEIERELQPRIESTQKELTQLIHSRSRFAAAETLVPRLAELRNRAASSDRTPRELPSLVSKSPQSAAVEEFTIVVQDLLHEWNYPDLTRVTFNQETLDLIISGKDRGNQGKGLRAIGYAAFVLGLMRYCRKKNLPHPGIVVIDSPLVTYQKPDDKPEDIISEDVKNAFFKSLAEWPHDQQVIVLENDEPPIDVRSRLNYLHFSGSKGLQRYGLFPV